MVPAIEKSALILKTVPEKDHISQQGLVATNSGFSLHAGVAIAGKERAYAMAPARGPPPTADDGFRQFPDYFNKGDGVKYPDILADEFLKERLREIGLTK